MDLKKEQLLLSKEKSFWFFSFQKILSATATSLLLQLLLKKNASLKLKLKKIVWKRYDNDEPRVLCYYPSMIEKSKV